MHLRAVRQFADDVVHLKYMYTRRTLCGAMTSKTMAYGGGRYQTMWKVKEVPTCLWCLVQREREP